MRKVEIFNFCLSSNLVPLGTQNTRGINTCIIITQQYPKFLGKHTGCLLVVIKTGGAKGKRYLGNIYVVGLLSWESLLLDLNLAESTR